MSYKSNCFCDCGKGIYRRPYEFEIIKGPYQCSVCRSLKINKNKHRICAGCKKDFLAKRKGSKFCSRKCTASNTRGTRRKFYPSRNTSLRNLKILKAKFNFETCMIEGCNYKTCFDIHRFVSGKEGGCYVIPVGGIPYFNASISPSSFLGNMFAICPNHHTEITRKIITVEKISDCLLRIIGTIGTLASPLSC